MSYVMTNSITIKDNSINSINYAGNINQDIFLNSDNINSFTNNGIILGGGGNSGFRISQDGKNGLINSGSINTIINTGSFLGGGGGASGGGTNGPGGAGGGGAGCNNQKSPQGSGGSLTNNNNGIDGNKFIFKDYFTGLERITGGNGGGGGPNGIGGISPERQNFVPGKNYGCFGGGGGGADATINGGGNSNVGGGGYGGGKGGNNGGGGGGGGTSSGAYPGGNGGYGIKNTGKITTLINSQGGLISNTDTNYYSYGPLFYCGNAPINYSIIINSTTHYGQLWCTGVINTIGSITFDIADDSILIIGNYSSVLKFNLNTVKINNTNGSYKGYKWSLVKNSLSTHESYDLLVTSIEKCFIKDSNNNIRNICIEYPYNKCNYMLNSSELKCYQQRYPNDLINMTNSDLQNHWSSIGCEQNRDNQCPAPQKTSALYNFKGCYNSGTEGLINSNKKVTSVDECSTITENNQETIFGIKNYGECWIGNDEKKILQYGENYDRNNCFLLGGSNTNQVYIRSKPYPPPPPPIPTLTNPDFSNENFESIKKYDRNNIIFIIVIIVLILVSYFYINKL